jgi:hypothetical protein
VHLFLDEPADATASLDRLTDKVLARVDITDESSYKAKLAEWCEHILAAMAARYQRLVTPGTDGIHLFEFDFTDNFLGHPNTAAAVTTRSNYINCPSCNAATKGYAPEYWSDDEDRDNRICACHHELTSDTTIVSYIPYKYVNGRLDGAADASTGNAARRPGTEAARLLP